METIKIKMSIGFGKFKPTRFKELSTAIAWVRKKGVANVQLRQGSIQWDNF